MLGAMSLKRRKFFHSSLAMSLCIGLHFTTEEMRAKKQRYENNSSIHSLPVVEREREFFYIFAFLPFRFCYQSVDWKVDGRRNSWFFLLIHREDIRLVERTCVWVAHAKFCELDKDVSSQLRQGIWALHEHELTLNSRHFTRHHLVERVFYTLHANDKLYFLMNYWALAANTHNLHFS